MAIRGSCSRRVHIASTLGMSRPFVARSRRAQTSLAGLLAYGLATKLFTEPVTVALPQRIPTAFPFHPTEI